MLVLNAGSSSLKFQLFGIEQGSLSRILRGQVDGIGAHPRLRVTGADGVALGDREYERSGIATIPAATAEARHWLREHRDLELAAVGHRVVHGGPEFACPVRVDAAVLERLTSYEALAPLHQPNNLAPIRQSLEDEPYVPQVACFDTAFHRGREPYTDCYALPWTLYEQGVRRYGFHGLSYEYVAGRLREIAPELARRRVIIAHLGNGASLCALRDGVSVESTMGFTALDGLPMGTRPGQLDPGVLLYLLESGSHDVDSLSDLLYRESGLKGLSGVSSDMRELLASDEPRAELALKHYVHRIGLCTGQLAAALGGLDAFVFTAGVGENAAPIRTRVARVLGWLGAELDEEANAGASTCISSASSRIGLYVIPTDEELMIARHTLAVLQQEP